MESLYQEAGEWRLEGIHGRRWMLCFFCSVCLVWQTLGVDSNPTSGYLLVYLFFFPNSIQIVMKIYEKIDNVEYCDIFLSTKNQVQIQLTRQGKKKTNSDVYNMLLFFFLR